MEDTSFASKMQELKKRVNDMLIERSKLVGTQETASPSPLWSDAISVFSYLMNLSPDDFRNIRFHTGLISGESWDYWAPYPEPDPETIARSVGYTEAIKDVPEAYWIGEPPTPWIPRPLGVSYKGRIINSNIARFQQCISNLYHVGALRSVLEAKEKQLIIEIGGGYGAVAHHVGHILGRSATYVIVDLPEMLLFAGAYLAVNNPEKSIYIYDSKTFTPEFVLQNIHEYNFVLIPNFALSKLQPIKEIALMLNMQSFQEMTDRQIEEYLEFGAKRITQYLYSDNVDRYPCNKDLVSLSTILEEYFDLYPHASYYDKLFRGTYQHWTNYYRKYFGIPKGSGRILPRAYQIMNLPKEAQFKIYRRTQLIRKLLPGPVRRAIKFWLGRLLG